MEVQVNSNMPQLASFGSVFTPSWAQWRQHGEPCFKRSAIDSKKTWKIQVKTGVLKISDWAGYASHLKPYGRQLGLKLLPNGSHFGAKVCHLGAKLGGSWGQVGKLGRSWGHSGRSGPKLGQRCGHVGSKRSIWTILGRSANCANYQSCALFRALSRANMAPPICIIFTFNFSMTTLSWTWTYIDIEVIADSSMLVPGAM